MKTTCTVNSDSGHVLEDSVTTRDMDRLQCKACGSMSMTPLEVEADEEEVREDPISMEEEEARFYTCHVCGDNWLTVRRVEPDGACQITFVHQMGLQPTLKRVAYMQTHILTSEESVDRWDYFMGEDSVEEDEWRENLDERRQLLRSICSN